MKLHQETPHQTKIISFINFTLFSISSQYLAGETVSAHLVSGIFTRARLKKTPSDAFMEAFNKLMYSLPLLNEFSAAAGIPYDPQTFENSNEFRAVKAFFQPMLTLFPKEPNLLLTKEIGLKIPIYNGKNCINYLIIDQRREKMLNIIL